MRPDRRRNCIDCRRVYGVYCLALVKRGNRRITLAKIGACAGIRGPKWTVSRKILCKRCIAVGLRDRFTRAPEGTSYHRQTLDGGRLNQNQRRRRNCWSNVATTKFRTATSTPTPPVAGPSPKSGNPPRGLPDWLAKPTHPIRSPGGRSIQRDPGAFPDAAPRGIMMGARAPAQGSRSRGDGLMKKTFGPPAILGPYYSVWYRDAAGDRGARPNEFGFSCAACSLSAAHFLMAPERF